MACATKRQVCPKSHEGLAEMLDDARERRQTEPESDTLAETAGGDEHEPPDPLGTLEEQHLRNAAPEGVTHDVCLLQADSFDPRGDDVRIPGELVSRIRTAGTTMAGQVWNQDSSIGGQQRRDMRP